MTFRRHLWKLAPVLLWAAAPAAAQTAEDLRGRYGPPVSETYARRPGFETGYGTPLSESYVVRPDVLLSVAYGEGGEACGLDLKPYSSSPELFPAPETFSPEEAALLVEELAPAAARGAAVNPSPLRHQREHTTLEFEEYEHLMIMRERRHEGGRLLAVGIDWKRRSCRGASARTPPDPESCFNTGGRAK